MTNEERERSRDGAPFPGQHAPPVSSTSSNSTFKSLPLSLSVPWTPLTTIPLSIKTLTPPPSLLIPIPIALPCPPSLDLSLDQQRIRGPAKITMVRLPYLTALTTLFSYGLLFAFGQLRDFFRKLIDWSKSKDLKVPPSSLVSILSPFCSSSFVRFLWYLLRIWSLRAIWLPLEAGLCADLLGPRGFLHPSPLSPHSGVFLI